VLTGNRQSLAVELFFSLAHSLTLTHLEVEPMNSDAEMPSSAGWDVAFIYEYSSDNRIAMRCERRRFPRLTDDTDQANSRAERLKFEHDTQKRLFVLTGPDGKTERFRDNPTRYLVVEPDPETGAMRPVIMHGEPSYIYLCREEREV
jgi:hypothetical protein